MLSKIFSFLLLYSHNHNEINLNSADTDAKTQADSVVSDRNGLLISDFGSWWHEERDTILKSLCWHHKRAAHPVIFKISVGRDPKILTTSFNGPNPTLCLNGRNSTFCLHGPISTSQLTLFQNPQILRTISFGHDVIYTPVTFPI